MANLQPPTSNLQPPTSNLQPPRRRSRGLLDALEPGKKSPCKPLLKWPGGKESELKEIEPLIPGHDRYFEPFFGGGSVFFGVIESPAYVNDIHPDLISFYRYIKSHNTEFFSMLESFLDEWDASAENRKEIYLKIRRRYNEAPEPSIRKATDFFILREFAYGGMFRSNARGEFNVPFGNGYVNKNIRSKIEHLRSEKVREKMNLLDISCSDFEVFMRDFDFTDHDFMFVDPPYDCAFTNYGTSNFSPEDQERLAHNLLEFKGKFMLVCQYTPLIECLYKHKKIKILFYEKKYKFNIKSRFSRSARHSMVMNYDANI